MPTYIVAAKGKWNKEIFQQHIHRLEGNWHLATTPTALNNLLETTNPRYIFFIHWSWVVPEKTVESYECVCFHMTDLPYGRGGSPLQNLILNGHNQTMLSAFRMNEIIDGGPIYTKRLLSLEGSAHEIYKRASLLSWKIISEIITHNPTPVPQTGKPTVFFRRKPEQSLIPPDLDDKHIYDFIRMLDAPGYPHAFITHGAMKLVFTNAELGPDGITAKVTITTSSKSKSE